MSTSVVTNLRTVSRVTFVVALLCGGAPAGFAHSPASGARVHQTAVITIHEDVIAIEYTTEFNRPYAFLEMLRLSPDGSPKSKEEVDRYFTQLSEALRDGLEISVGGKQVPLKQIGKLEKTMSPGQDEVLGTNDDLFQRFNRFEVPQPPGWKEDSEGTVVEFHNDNYLDQAGEILIAIDPGSGADIVYNSLWEEEASDARLAAASTLLPADPQQRDVTFRYRRGTGKQDPPEDWRPASTDLAGRLDAGSSPGADPPVPPVDRGTTIARIALALMCAGMLLCVGTLVAAGGMGPRATRLAAACGALLAVSTAPVAWAYHNLPQQQRWNIAIPSDDEAGELFRKLHGNIYRAFKAQTEDEIYDVLARSLEGDVLEDVYNEVFEALVLRNDGNTRFDVRRVKPLSTKILPAEDIDAPAFRVRYRWRIYSTVTHLRHTHARFNEYEATYVVRHDGRSWHIADSEVRRHERVSIGQS